MVGFTAVVVMMAMLVAQGGEGSARDAAKAEETFQSARALLNEGRYEEACRKFDESQREDPASGTLLALAYCEELAGSLASAWTNYKAAAELADREGDDERRDAARKRCAVLADRVSVLTLIVPREVAELPAFRLSRDGVPVKPAAFGTEVPVDGGTHRVVASASGRTSWSATVTIGAEGDKKTLTIELLEPLKPAEPPDFERNSLSTSIAARPEHHAPGGDFARGLEQASIAVGLGSLASLGLGITFGVMAKVKNDASNADGHCDSRGCDSRGTALRNDALASAKVSTWFFVAGGALALGSLGLYVGARAGTDRSGPSVATTALPGGARIAFAMAF